MPAAASITSPPRATNPIAEALDRAVACGTGAARRSAHGHDTTQRTSIPTTSPDITP